MCYVFWSIYKLSLAPSRARLFEKSLTESEEFADHDNSEDENDEMFV